MSSLRLVSASTPGSDPQAPCPSPRTITQVAVPGRFVELSGSRGGACGIARTTTAVALVRHAQHEGETVVWVQPEGGGLFPPDLAPAGIDLEALVVVHVPPTGLDADPHRKRGVIHVESQRLFRAAELLLRSGAFGLVVLDACHVTAAGASARPRMPFTAKAPPVPIHDAWQGRLLGLARHHEVKLVVITEKPAAADSLGPLVGVRLEPQRFRDPSGTFVVEHRVLKNKSGTPLELAPQRYRGPLGLAVRTTPTDASTTSPQ